MANQWLRLWHDMPNDPKWRTISRVSKQTIPNVMAVYVHLLVNASNATERGRTQNVCNEDIASSLDLECEQVDAIIAAMQGRVLDGDQVSGWSKRQVEREDGSAERAKAWREARKLEKEQGSSADRTQPNAHDRKRAPDTDTDTDKKNTEDSSDLLAQSEPTLTDFSIPLNDSTEYRILEKDLSEWKQAYQAVDVEQELRQIRAWVLANPTKRKTRRGAPSFIVRWLSKAQDLPHRNTNFGASVSGTSSAFAGGF